VSFTRKRNVNFNVFNAPHLILAACRGNAGYPPLAPKAFKQVEAQILQSTQRSSWIGGGRVRDGYLLVTDRSGIRFVGLVSFTLGFNGPRTDLSQLKVTARGSVTLTARIWSDGFLWRRLVKYAFKHQKFTGDFIEGIADEQSRRDILTNRDGNNASPTWASLGEDPRVADDFFDKEDYDADVELALNPETGANRGAVNFTFPPGPPRI
jgi:hypothetical protein